MPEWWAFSCTGSSWTSRESRRSASGLQVSWPCSPLQSHHSLDAPAAPCSRARRSTSPIGEPPAARQAFHTGTIELVISSLFALLLLLFLLSVASHRRLSLDPGLFLIPVCSWVCVWCVERCSNRNPAPRCKCVLTPSHLSKQFSQLQYDVWEQAGVGLLCRPVTEYERKSKRGKKKETQEMLQWAALHLWVVITNKLFPLFCVISPHPVIVQRVGFPKDYADLCTSQVLERHPQTPLGWRNHLCLFFAFESSEKNSTQAM